jgi:CRP-like cAMP-binding protein
MAMLTNVDLIRRVPLFAKLSVQQMEKLAAGVIKKRYRRGEIIVEQGKVSNSLFIILNGRARVLITDRQGREVILATLREADYLGEMSLIDSQSHSATVAAEIMTDVLILRRENFMQCLEESTTMAMEVMHGLVQRLRSADRKIGSLALTGVYARVANALLESAQVDASGVRMIKDKVSRQDIAKMVGASREMVSRVMKDFEEQGFIETLETGSVLVKERRSVER